MGSFEVGDWLRAWPRDGAQALAAYRQAVDAFLSTRVADVPSAPETPVTTPAQDAADVEASAHASSAEATHRLDTATGAAAVLKAQSAGELQGMLDFLASRQTGDQLILLSYGVGQPRDEEMIMAQDALEQEVPCAIFALNLKVPPERHQRAAAHGVRIREHTVFHEMLTEMLEMAGLPAPARELATMRQCGAREG